MKEVQYLIQPATGFSRNEICPSLSQEGVKESPPSWRGIVRWLPTSGDVGGGSM